MSGFWESVRRPAVTMEGNAACFPLTLVLQPLPQMSSRACDLSTDLGENLFTSSIPKHPLYLDLGYVQVQVQWFKFVVLN